jgi:hypothetical protein
MGAAEANVIPAAARTGDESAFALPGVLPDAHR